MLHLLGNVNITGTGTSPVGGPSVPLEGVSLVSTITDPMSIARISVLEQPPVLSIQPQQQYVCIDENGAASNPTHNFLCNGGLIHPTSTQWAVNSPLGTFLSDNSPGFQIVVANAANGAFPYELQNIQLGYIIPGQKYSVSIYEHITASFVGANANFKFDFLDASGAIISGGASDFRSSTAGQIRITLTGTAPANAASIQVVMAVLTTSNTNSGTVQYKNVQVECQWFKQEGITYPTPICVSGQANCTVLPDSTVVRQTRLFAGYIQTVQAIYEGTLRTSLLVIASNSIILDTQYLANANYVNSADGAGVIVSSINANFLVGSQLAQSGNGLYTLITSNNVINGATIDYLSVADMTFKDVLATCANSSGYYYYVDHYFDLHYCPPGYEQAGFGLAGNGGVPNAAPTDGSLPTYAFYNYKYTNDGSQIKNRVKVFGGKFIAPQITDSFVGNGATKNFLLSQIPYNITNVKRDGADITSTTGVVGINTNGVGGIVALYDKATPTLKYNTAPATSGSITYTYAQDVIVRTRDMGSIAKYNRIFDSKINDTSLNSLLAADQRGLAELVQFSQARGSVVFTTQRQLTAGQSFQLTSNYDSLFTAPFIVQRSTQTYRGNGIYEWAIEAGAYNPDVVALLVNIHKALLRNPVQAGQIIQEEHYAVIDTLTLQDRETHSP